MTEATSLLTYVVYVHSQVLLPLKRKTSALYITKYLIYGVVITARVVHERSKGRREIDTAARGNRRDPTAVRNLSFLFPTLPFFAGAAAAAVAGWRREVTNFFINMQRDTPNSLLFGKGNVVAGAKREKMQSPPGVHVQPSRLVCVCLRLC